VEELSNFDRMRRGPHRKIIVLLALSLLSIVLVQALWLRNFYVEKKKQFTMSVHNGLEQVVDRLHEREQLKIIKERGDSLLASRRKMARVLSRRKTKTIKETRTMVPPGTALVFSDKAMYVAGTDDQFTFASINADPADSIVSTYSKKTSRHGSGANTAGASSSFSIDIVHGNLGPGSRKVLISSINTQQVMDDSSGEAEIEALMGKMMTEIRIDEMDETNPDSLRSVIAGVLRSKGILVPFEFSLRKISGGTQQKIVQSTGFDSTKISFSADLSEKKVFRTNNYLLLQIPDQDSLVMASMKGSLLLSFLFLGIILSVFYYTVVLIVKQKKLSDIRNDFVNNMTHELKTPIATISLAVDAMQHKQVRESEENYNTYTRILKEENQKLNTHVEKVLQLALFDKGEVKMNLGQADVADVAQRQVDGYILHARSKNVTLHFFRSGESLRAAVDEEHLGAAISNLIDNALKYTGEGGTVGVKVQEANGRVSISVSDTGRGISKGDLEKIFDRFYRVRTKDLHDVKGFGIGLSYVRSIVEAHGGNISVESVPGKGSTFKIILAHE
jgi:two-component system phosphate regulon sensor histidine kinase PhoR